MTADTVVAGVAVMGFLWHVHRYSLSNERRMTRIEEALADLAKKVDETFQVVPKRSMDRQA